MAKQILVASTDSPRSSVSTSCRRQDPIQPPYRPRHRRHRSPNPSSSSAPSSALLVLLASVVSASTANGSPAPPSFLCPSLGLEDSVDCLPKKRALSSPITISSPGPTNILSPRHVPDRYHQDTDGVWRRVASYTLYGSTVSACGSTCRQPTNIVSAVDDQIQVSGSSNSTDTSAIPTYDIRDTLPPGWKPTTRVQSRTPLILSVSLVLALVICFFIISCLFWRKRVKKGHKNNDVEAKAKKKRDRKGVLKDEMVKELLAEKEYKSQQKVWAKATARWKANIRFTARLRRGKRFNPRLSQAQQSSLSQDLSHSRSAGYNSSIRSMSSRRSSISSIPDQVHTEERPSTPSTVPQEQPPPSPSNPQNSNLPPAYQHGQIPPMTISTDGVPGKTFYTPSTLDRGQTSSPSSSLSASGVTNDGQVVELLPAPLHVAHVATDDKSLLARLADLASSPPVEGSHPSVGTSEAQGSAPAWHDEDIEDIAPELASVPGQSSNTMFPPPPSKEMLASSAFYDYPFAFHEMEPPEADDGQPSAPPFEESASPSLHDPHFMVPSAPPLLEDDHDQNHAVAPSAPEWDSISNSSEQDSAADGQNHDRMDSQSPVSVPPSSPPHISTTPTPSPPEGSSTTNDGVVLPGYQP